MTLEERIKMKRKLEKELNSEPEISIGDTIVCRGIHATIAKLYYTFRSVELNLETDEYAKCYDVEFVDTNGNYRHWKSYFDGGHIIYKER